jgi:hypothetical protein
VSELLIGNASPLTRRNSSNRIPPYDGASSPEALPRRLVMTAIIFLGLTAGLSLSHRYLETNAFEHHLDALRLFIAVNPLQDASIGANVRKHLTDSDHSRRWAKMCLLGAGAMLFLGAASLGLAFSRLFS